MDRDIRGFLTEQFYAHSVQCAVRNGFFAVLRPSLCS